MNGEGMATRTAKEGSYTLRTDVSENGVKFPLQSKGGRWYGGDDSMILTWAEWDRLATWIAHQRALAE